MVQSMDSEKHRIYKLLLENPGLYLTKIAEKCNMSIMFVEQHLKAMEHAHLVISNQEGGYKRYYVYDDNGYSYGSTISGTRKKIYELIIKYPGLSLTRISELLEMGTSLARYHLNYLEKNDSLLAIKEDGYKRYYVKSSDISVDDRRLLSLFRQDIPLEIVHLLIEHENMQHKQLLECFDVAPSTLTYHLNKLVKAGVASIQTYGKEKGYTIKNKKAIIDFLRKYRMQKMLRDFKDIWSSIKYEY